MGKPYARLLVDQLKLAMDTLDIHIEAVQKMVNTFEKITFDFDKTLEENGVRDNVVVEAQVFVDSTFRDLLEGGFQMLGTNKMKWPPVPKGLNEAYKNGTPKKQVEPAAGA